jgi:hypothetical protein
MHTLFEAQSKQALASHQAVSLCSWEPRRKSSRTSSTFEEEETGVKEDPSRAKSFSIQITVSVDLTDLEVDEQDDEPDCQ